MPSPVRFAPLALALGALLALAQPARALEWSGVVQEGSGGVTGMKQASDVVVSPDGLFAYVAGHGGNSIAIFARDAATGALAYQDNVAWDGNVPAGSGTIPNLRQPVSLAVSSDGANLYAVGATGVASNITSFARDAQTGALTYLDSISNDLSLVTFPLDVLVSADGLNVYVTSFDGPSLTVLQRDPQTGLLAVLQVVHDDMDAPGIGIEGIQSLAESPDGAYLYVASASRPVTTPGLGGISTFARAADGQLTFVDIQQQNLNGVDGLWAPRGVAVSPDGHHVYVAAGGRPLDAIPQPGSLDTFERQADGKLALKDVLFESEIPLLAGSVPRRVEVSHDGSTVYMISYGRFQHADGSLSVFTRNTDTGILTPDRVFHDAVAGVQGLSGALGLALSPDDLDVYVASEEPYGGADAGAVAIFNPVPEPSTTAAGLLALASLGALAQRVSASQSRGRRNSE